MLKATPEAATENQPLVDVSRGLALVWDGRLDNRGDLYKKLQPRFPRHGIPDCAYAMEAYARWGDETPRHLEGDFAFAVWDAKRRSLFCARDIMGGRPFAYVANQRMFAFASDWEALLGLPGVSDQPNEDRIASLLVGEFIDRNDRRTWQQDVLTLWAGESISVRDPGAVQFRRYGRLQPAQAQNYGSLAECSEHFLEVFGESVRCRLRTLGAPAVMLSGGLDSAGLFAMTRRLLTETDHRFINSFSVIDDDVKASRESGAIQCMAGLAGVNPHFVSVPSLVGVVGLEDLVDIAWSRAHPADNSILIPTLMYLAASREGVRVMLHGASGDVTLSSSPRYIAYYLRAGQHLRAWKECKAASQNHVYLRTIPPFRLFALNFARAFVPVPIKRPITRWFRRREPLERNSMVNTEFAAKTRLFERIESRFRDQERASASEIAAVELENTRQSIASTLVLSARAAARFGVEARDPWADRRVAEFFLGLPMEYKVHNGWTKYLVRASFERDLAPEILWRRDKEHLGWKCTQRLIEESEQLISRVFNEDLHYIEKYINVDVAKAIFATYLNTRDLALQDTVFKLATLIMWLKRVNSDMHGVSNAQIEQ